MIAVVGKLVAQRKAELFVRSRWLDRILEIVGVGIALAAEIEPGLRVLMREQRVIPRNVFDSLEPYGGACPRLPRFGGDEMRRRSQRQQVDHHELAVVAPAAVQEA